MRSCSSWTEHDSHCRLCPGYWSMNPRSSVTQPLGLSTGTVGIAPGVVRRGMLVLLQTLAPYIVEHLPVHDSSLHAPMQPHYARMPAMPEPADGNLTSTSGVVHRGPMLWLVKLCSYNWHNHELAQSSCRCSWQGEVLIIASRIAC